jgi:hypothetical protein
MWHARERNVYGILVGKSEKGDNLEYLCLDADSAKIYLM